MSSFTEISLNRSVREPQVLEQVHPSIGAAVVVTGLQEVSSTSPENVGPGSLVAPLARTQELLYTYFFPNKVCTVPEQKGCV